MSVVLLLIAAVLLWLGVDALLLSRHSLRPTQIERDEMMLKGHRRPIPDYVRSFFERRYPIATSASMQFYGWLFVVLGLCIGAMGVGVWE